MISFILSLVVIDHQQRQWRLSQHNSGSNSLWSRLTHLPGLNPEPYQNSPDSTWKHNENAASDNTFRGWYTRKKHRAVAKMEVNDAFEMRGRLMVALAVWASIGIFGLIYAVKGMYGWGHRVLITIYMTTCDILWIEATKAPHEKAASDHPASLCMSIATCRGRARGTFTGVCPVGAIKLARWSFNRLNSVRKLERRIAIRAIPKARQPRLQSHLEKTHPGIKRLRADRRAESNSTEILMVHVTLVQQGALIRYMHHIAVYKAEYGIW